MVALGGLKRRKEVPIRQKGLETEVRLGKFWRVMILRLNFSFYCLENKAEA